MAFGEVLICTRALLKVQMNFAAGSPWVKRF
jgi:hypothetical protein